MNIPGAAELPIWIRWVGFVVVLVTAIEAGYRTGLWRRRKDPEWEGVSDMVSPTMFALLGLMLAFTYAYTVSRADHRKQAVIDETNAISTAFLRADFAPEPARTELRKALLDYTRTRLVTAETAGSDELAQDLIARTLEAQSRLWPVAQRIVEDSARGPLEASLTQAINEVIDMHGTRLAAALDRLPGPVLLMVLFIAGAALATAGYTRGLTGKIDRWRLTVLALVLASVVALITDFDEPLRGVIRVSEKGLEQLILDMEATLAE